MQRITTGLLFGLLGLGIVANTFAQGSARSNVDLSTVPARDSVQLTIYNSEDLTLVRETRVVSFKKGLNPLQFSWANTLIDPTSVRLAFVTHADKLELLDAIRRTLPGHVVFRSGLKAKNHDYQTVEYTATVKPGAKADLLYEVRQHQGRNAKQNNVTVEEAEVGPQRPLAPERAAR